MELLLSCWRVCCIILFSSRLDVLSDLLEMRLHPELEKRLLLDEERIRSGHLVTV